VPIGIFVREIGVVIDVPGLERWRVVRPNAALVYSLQAGDETGATTGNAHDIAA